MFHEFLLDSFMYFNICQEFSLTFGLFIGEVKPQFRGVPFNDWFMCMVLQEKSKFWTFKIV